jgi:hypothetical protein
MVLTNKKTYKKYHSYWLWTIRMFCYLWVVNLNAQSSAEDNSVANDRYRREHWKADVSLSSSGIGIGFGWKPYETRWIFRAKYSYMAGDLGFGLPIRGNNGDSIAPIILNIQTKFRMSHFDLLADYLIRWDENFKITVGLGYHPHKNLSAEGSIRNFKYRDLVFTPEEIGSVKLYLSSKYKLSPYLGVGFGRSIPSTRLRLSGEFGFYYLGNWRVDSVKIQEGIILNNWSKQKDLILQSVINAHDGHKFLPNLNLMINWLLY